MRAKGRSAALIGAGVLFALFCVNIVIGKISVLSGATQVPGLGDVGEFLVLFAAVVLFMAGCLLQETVAQPDQLSETVDKGGD